MRDLFPLLFLQASVSCVLLGCVVWALLALATRIWPGLAMQRAPWLLALAAVCAVFVLVMLPSTSRLSLMPVQQLPLAPTSTHATGAVLMEASPGAAGDDLDEVSYLPAIAWTWLACYATGLLAASARSLRGRRHLKALLRAAQPLDADALSAHPAFAASAGSLPPVLEVEAPVSPMLVGLRRPVLLLPRHLRAFAPDQQQLIADHELTHWKRRDHWWQHAGLLVQTIMWFNPAVGSLRRHMGWAQELGCDRDVLAGRPQQQRKSYAAALVAQLQIQQQAHGQMRFASLAFGGAAVDSVAARIRLIRHADWALPGVLARSAALLVLLALLGASVLLQPAFAWRVEHPAPVASLPAPATALHAPLWHAPLERMRVSSAYGSVSRPSAKPHRGTDFATPSGTPVMAVADGAVLVSTDTYEGGAKYGKVIVIEHANGARSLYAHLDRRAVQAGDMVRAGQAIAQSGATGKVTGPHLHLEAFDRGEHLDPQRLIAPAPALAVTHAN